MSDVETEARAYPAWLELPEEVRARVVVLTADVLPSVPRVPPALRKVAEFAPARRARLGGTPISAALASDEEFRERVGVQLAAGVPGPLADLDAAEAELEADPVELAALAWLIRPDGGDTVLATATRLLAERPTATAAGSAEVHRWREKAQAADDALREARTRHRADLADLKADNATLRRKLGEARSALKDAVAAAEDAGRSAEEAHRHAEAAATAQDRELRQLRAQVERLEADAQAGRRTARADRDDATIRARLLLETVIDAASGLRRELGLPAVAGNPADRVEAGLEPEGSRPTSAAGSLGPSSPALLEQLLAMPRARLIVDGYNVSKTSWPSSSLEAQRIRLLNGIAPLVARTGAETTVVFDAAGSTSRPVVNAPRGVKVLFSPEGVIADDVIRDLVEAEPAGRVVVVVTSDQEVARDVARGGARVVGSDALVALLARQG